MHVSMFVDLYKRTYKRVKEILCEGLNIHPAVEYCSTKLQMWPYIVFIIILSLSYWYFKFLSWNVLAYCWTWGLLSWFNSFTTYLFPGQSSHWLWLRWRGRHRQWSRGGIVWFWFVMETRQIPFDVICSVCRRCFLFGQHRLLSNCTSSG